MPRNIDLYIGAVIQGLMVISIVLAIIFWKHDKKPMRTILTISIFQFACNVLIILLGITIADSFYYFIIGSFLAILGPHRLVSGTGGILSMGVLWGLVTIFAFCKRRRFRFSETREATE